jgi:hypothetical protein
MKLYTRIYGKSYTKEDLAVIAKHIGAKTGMDSVTGAGWDGYNKHVIIEGTLKGKPHKYWVSPTELSGYPVPSRQGATPVCKNMHGEYYHDELEEFAKYVASSICRGKYIKYAVDKHGGTITIIYKYGKSILPSKIDYSMYDLEKFLVKQHGGIVK